jgi:hypothetical protein
MAKQTFTTGQVLTAAQMTSLQQTAMLGGDTTAKTVSYTLLAADAGTTVAMSNAGSTTITVNTSLFAAGDIVTIQNRGAGVCTVTAGTATVNTSGSLVLAQYQGGVLYFTSTSAAIFFQFATPESGDITGVTAGTGLSGGGTSGTVTITNSMATAIDSKGDLVAGTGADAFARLGVGANETVLTADSAEATGLKWATPSSGSAQVAGKNAILNGDFLINQRAFTSNTTTGAYNFDRWLQQNSGGTFTVTPQSFTPGTAPIATYEGRKYFQGITATQSAAGDYAILTQRIEDVTRYAGTTVTVSFFAKANTGTPKIGVELWQDFGTGGSPSTAATAAQSSVTLTTAWARYSVTLAVPALTGKTLGTTANTSYLELNLWQSAGSTYNTRASTIGIQNFTNSIWGVQLEYASSATYFTTATGTLQGELAACQRYYYQSDTDIQTWATLQYQANVNVSRGGTLYFPQTMRTIPTLTLFDSPGNSGKISVSAGSGGYSDNITPNMFGTSRNTYAYYAVGSYVLGYTSKFTASAEL